MYLSWIFLAVELLGHSIYMCSVLVGTDPKVSHYVYTNSHSHQQCFRVLLAPPPYQHLVLSVLLIVGILVDFIIIVWHFGNRTISTAPKT